MGIRPGSMRNDVTKQAFRSIDFFYPPAGVFLDFLFFFVFVVLVSANSLVSLVVIDCLSVGECAGWSLLSLCDSLHPLFAPPTRLPSSFLSHRVDIPR